MNDEHRDTHGMCKSKTREATGPGSNVAQSPAPAWGDTNSLAGDRSSAPFAAAAMVAQDPSGRVPITRPQWK